MKLLKVLLRFADEGTGGAVAAAKFLAGAPFAERGGRVPPAPVTLLRADVARLPAERSAAD